MTPVAPARPERLPRPSSPRGGVAVGVDDVDVRRAARARRPPKHLFFVAGEQVGIEQPPGGLVRGHVGEAAFDARAVGFGHDAGEQREGAGVAEPVRREIGVVEKREREGD